MNARISHKDVKEHVRAVFVLVDQLEDFVETNKAAIRLNQRIEVLRNRIAKRKHASLSRCHLAQDRYSFAGLVSSWQLYNLNLRN